MLDAVHNFIPCITSEAGLCLSAENWREAKVNTVSYGLEFLLHKPGLALLHQINNLAEYLGWQGILVLNAASLATNREGVCVVRSPYDGSKIQLSSDELVSLIEHLKPDAVILPKNILQNCPKIWNNWSDATFPFVHADDLQYQNVARPHGVYFHYTDDSVLRLLDKWSHLSRYVIGQLDAELIQQLRAKGIQWIETDTPASAALTGRVYTHQGEIDISAADAQMQFETIDAACECPVCSTQLTRAYFHHLLEHTPLLCQRFLIQHNAFFLATS